MPHNDPIASALTHIRNACGRGLASTQVPCSKIICAMLDVMKEEGFISSYDAHPEQHTVDVVLGYTQQRNHQKKPVIESIQRVSKLSRRRFIGVDELKQLTVPGFGVYILTTPKGVMTHHRARALNVGGEMLCLVA